MNECGSFLEHALARAAEEIGDIVPAISDRFFQLHPEAQASFAEHAPRNRTRLQSEMIDNCLYVIEQILEDSPDLEIFMELSVAHHQRSLNVSGALYFDLIRSTVSILAGNRDRLAAEEREQWAWIALKIDGIAERVT